MIEEVRILLDLGPRSNHGEPDPHCGIAYQREPISHYEGYAKTPKETDEHARPGDGVTPEEFAQTETMGTVATNDQDGGGDGQQTPPTTPQATPIRCPVQGAKALNNEL